MLKYMHDRVEQAICQEENTEVVTASALAAIGNVTPRSLCGFELPADMVRNDQIVRDRAARRVRIASYRDGAARLRQQLASIGIEPIAIITAKAFDRLVAEMGLFMLRPTESGTVDVDRTDILALRGYGAAPVGKLVVGCVVAVTFVTLVLAFRAWGWTIGDDPFRFSFAAALIPMATVLVWGFAGACREKIEARGFAKRAQAWVRTLSWEQMLVALSHRHHGTPTRAFYPPNFEGYGAFQRTIVLPTAPADVIDKVCRILRFNATTKENHGLGSIHIAAEASAISFRDGLKGLFDLEAIEAQLAWEARVAADPILFLRGYGDVVAVIAQYGDLPDERETVDRIVNSEHLL